MKRLATLVILISLSVACPPRAHSDDSKNPNGNVYFSQADKMITIHKIGILPVTDNVHGLYSRYVEDKIGEILKKSHRFDLSPVREVDSSSTIDDYENSPDKIQDLTSKNGVDALIGARVMKTEKGVDITMDLFLAADGQLLLQKTGSTAPAFNTTSVEDKTTELYSQLLDQLPYKGLILSREGNRVTMDLGTQDGIKNNTIVSVEQILLLKRHPKFHFIVGSEKEIMGKVKVVKADATLSFGVVLEEKERGAIGTDSKITGIDFVTYPEAIGTPGLQPSTTDVNPAQDAVSFGEHPKEWLPPKQPSIGEVSLSLGLGSLQNTITLKSAGSLQSNVSIYPQLLLAGEIWLTPNWFAGADIAQGVMSITNPNSGSSPGSLGSFNSHYDFHAGYKFLLQDDFWGPLINVHMGIGQYYYFVDASTPLTFTTQTYSGLYLGLGASMPINQQRTWYADVNLDKYIAPNLTETPESSGLSSDNSVTTFNIGGRYKLSNQFWVIGHLNFEFYSTTFSGTGTRSDTGLNSSQSLTTLFGGIQYMF